MRLQFLGAKARNEALCAALLAIGALSLTLCFIILPWNGGEGPTLPGFFWSALLSLVVATFITIFLPLSPLASRILGHVRAVPPSSQLRNVANEISVALNRPLESIVIHDSEALNVAMLPANYGDVVLATSAASKHLTRDELQALVAAQFAGLEDRWCKLATRAEIVWWGTKFLAIIAFLATASGQVVYHQ